MKHRHSNRPLGRKRAPRKRLMENLAQALLLHGSIVTSEANAKELRRFFEPLITHARKEKTLHVQRLLTARLGTKVGVDRLFKVAQDMAGRPGGYTRITHLPSQRQDSAREVRIDIVRESVQK